MPCKGRVSARYCKVDTLLLKWRYGVARLLQLINKKRQILKTYTQKRLKDIFTVSTATQEQLGNILGYATGTAYVLTFAACVTSFTIASEFLHLAHSDFVRAASPSTSEYLIAAARMANPYSLPLIGAAIKIALFATVAGFFCELSSRLPVREEAEDHGRVSPRTGDRPVLLSRPA